ncbi:Uncharacterised protein [Halioglobus japonicus]|nr:Uncharacterised protein [Halioglobus japonicus]
MWIIYQHGLRRTIARWRIVSQNAKLFWRQSAYLDIPGYIDDLTISYGGILPVRVPLGHPIAVIYFTDRAR